MDSKSENPRIIIVGAGIAGIGAAQYLYTRGLRDVMVLEATNRVGGRIWTLRLDEDQSQGEEARANGSQSNDINNADQCGLRGGTTVKDSNKFGDGSLIEMGAQWIHGQEGNELYELAKKRKLITCGSIEHHEEQEEIDDKASTTCKEETEDDAIPEDDQGIEGEGKFCTDDGHVINEHAINEVIMVLASIKEELMSGVYNHLNRRQSAGHVFYEKFAEYVRCDDCKPIHSEELLWGVYHWFQRFEVIDNSCDDLNLVALTAYSEYHECAGVPLVNFNRGYESVIRSLIQDFASTDQNQSDSPIKTKQDNVGDSQNIIKLNHIVEQIDYSNDDNQVRLNVIIKDDETGDSRQEQFVADHVIFTGSIGYLKDNHKTLFNPMLPESKINIIEGLGFGTIDKIYLKFKKPFWSQRKDYGFQLIWLRRDYDDLPGWVYDISGFDEVRGQPNFLVAWIGGRGAEQMELEQNKDKIGSICAQVLRLFLRNREIEEPIKTYVTRWRTHEYIRGAYSYRSLQFEQLANCPIEELSSPINGSGGNKPVLLLAGEANHPRFYSTTHGALSSGWSQAAKICQYWHADDHIIPYKD